jgi:hypothetical protein
MQGGAYTQPGFACPSHSGNHCTVSVQHKCVAKCLRAIQEALARQKEKDSLEGQMEVKNSRLLHMHEMISR